MLDLDALDARLEAAGPWGVWMSPEGWRVKSGDADVSPPFTGPDGGSKARFIASLPSDLRALSEELRAERRKLAVAREALISIGCSECTEGGDECDVLDLEPCEVCTARRALSEIDQEASNG
jgi:hypothetical protein